ncbi:hypothetical protein BDW67DRAFT_188135 [Aspergillus spinulosporus]
MRRFTFLALAPALVKAQGSSETNTCGNTAYIIPEPSTAFVTPTGDLPAPTILKPSPGEVITIGQPYTIEWTPQTVPGHVELELHSERGSAEELIECRYTCTGWAINTECSQLTPLWIPEGETSVVWDVVNATDYESHSDGGRPYWNRLIVYVGANHGISQDARWFAETSNFTFFNPWVNTSSFESLPTTRSNSLTSSTRTTDATTTTTTAMETDADAENSVPTPTGTASQTVPRWRTVMLVSLTGAIAVAI